MSTSGVLEVPATPSASTGELMLNRYRPICRLGRGGQADVFLAMTPGPADFQRLVVIKVLREASRSPLTDVDSFLAEARLAARLNHPNVVQTYEVGDYRGKPCIVMEHLEGQPLDRVGHEARRTQQNDLDALWVRVIADALGGLAYAHELADYERRPLNIVHRDISPQNIFVTYHGQVKVLDFGIARMEGSSSNTGEGLVKGKANYLAPEQIKAGAVDARADLFAIGVVLWELLTGVRLIKGEGPQAIFFLMNETLPRLRDKRPDINPQLDDILARALEKDPGRRYPSAAAMRQALEGYLESLPSAPRTDDVAQLLQNLFEAQRDAVRRKIRGFMNNEPTDDLDSTSQLLTLDSLKVPVLSTAIRQLSTGTIIPPASSGSRFFVFAGVAILALGAAGFWGSSRGWLSPPPEASSPAPAAEPAAPPTVVAIDSEPSGATVFAGDRELGTTPLTIPIPSSAMDLRLAATGFADAEATVAANDTASQLVVLERTGGEDGPAAKKPPAKSSKRTARRPSKPRAKGGTKKTPPPTTTPEAKPAVTIIDDDGPNVRVID